MSTRDISTVRGWHPSSVDVAIATLRWLKRNARRVLRHADEISAYIADRLGTMKLEEVRIRGMAIAADTGDEDSAWEIAERCRKSGLLLTTSGAAITMFPPLILDRRTAKQGLTSSRTRCDDAGSRFVNVRATLTTPAGMRTLPGSLHFDDRATAFAAAFASRFAIGVLRGSEV